MRFTCILLLDWKSSQIIKCAEVKEGYIYGLKKSPRAWYHKLSTTFIGIGFRRYEADHTLFTPSSQGTVIALCIVDDIIITWSDKEGIQSTKAFLKSVFFLNKDIGELKYFLGIEVCLFKSVFHEKIKHIEVDCYILADGSSKSYLAMLHKERRSASRYIHKEYKQKCMWVIHPKSKLIDISWPWFHKQENFTFSP